MVVPTPTADEMALGTIDLSRFRDGTPEEKELEAQKILDAATGLGFMYVKGTGPTEEQVDGMFDMYREFFAEPFEEKDKYRKKGPTSNFQGYSPMDGVLAQPRTYDFWKGADNPVGSTACKEHISIPNVAKKEWWKDYNLPPVIKRNLGSYNKFIEDMQSMVVDILQGLAFALKIPESEGGRDFFLKAHDFAGDSQNFLRCLHYPPLPQGDDDMEGVLRTKRFPLPGHTDTGSLTILFQHLGGDGLQIRPLVPTGSTDSTGNLIFAHSPNWIDVPPRRGHAVVNFADTLQWWTNGVVKSTYHRVAPKQGGKQSHDRYSIGWFQYATEDTLLSPVPSPLIPPSEHGIKHEGLENTGFVTAGQFYHWYNTNFIQSKDHTRKELEGN